MKTAVVYYSLDGSTKEAAEQIAQRLNAPIFELEEEKREAESRRLSWPRHSGL